MAGTDAAGAGDVILELDRLTRQFGTVTALDGVSQQFGRGEYCCILGPSGCGKTTLLRLVAGFETPDAGSIRLNGVELTGVPPERRDVNVVFQHFALFPHMSVADNVAFGLRMRKLPRDQVGRQVRDALALVQLSAEADRLPRQLSGGQQQRVALARALANRPAVLLLDEPLSALDQSLRRQMQDELRRIQRDTAVTFLHITHDQDEALSLADRVAVMRAGRFVQVGSPRDVYLKPASRFVASFVGAANLLHAQADAHGLAIDGAVLPWPAGTGAARATRRDGAVLVAIRPEAIGLAESDASAGPVGVVKQLSYRGADVECVVELARSGVAVRVRRPASEAASLGVGDRVALLIRADDVVVLPDEAAL